jgi:hypothetical protein
MRIISVKETFEKGNYDCLVLAVSSHGKEKDNGNDVVSFEIVWKHRAMGQKYKIDRLFEHSFLLVVETLFSEKFSSSSKRNLKKRHPMNDYGNYFFFKYQF